MNIPSIIKQQLLQTGIIRVWSWGADKWRSTAYNTLTFKVNAHRFKGAISIILNEEHDLYEIHFFDNCTLRSFNTNPKPSKKFPALYGVFFDQLVDFIDDKIEKIDAYQY